MRWDALLFATLVLVTSADARHAQAFESGVAQGDGVELHYTLHGEGPPLLILNGGPGFPSTHFRSLADSLSKNHQAILFDQRGTGASKLDKLNSKTVNLDLMVDDIEALREHLGIEEWIVMGHSWGGIYAMLYASRHPGRVRGLVLSASGGIDLRFTTTVQRNIRSRLTEEGRALYDGSSPDIPDDETSEEARRRRVTAMAPAYVYREENVPRVIEALTDKSAFVPRINSLVFQDLRRTHYDLRDELSTFEKPALVIQGRHDFLGDETALGIHETLPNSAMVWLKESGHYMWWDQPRKYLDTIATFLAAIPS